MNCKIPFTKDIDFDHKLYEITSISLEHEIKTEEGYLKGNFIVSGDYKSHEVSVNKEPFSYILPFEITLAENIDESTIEFMIEDFTYEIIENNVLRVRIDFNVIASTKESEEDPNETRLFEDTNNLFESTLEILPELLTEEQPNPEALKETSEEVNLKEVETTKTEINEDTIINNIKSDEDEYATYHIHMVNDGESIETICTMYNSSMNILSEYNDLSELSSGDKLIIPDEHE